MDTLADLEDKFNWPLSKLELADIAHEMTAMVVVRFTDGLIVGATPEVNRLFGYIPGTLESGTMYLNDLIPPEYHSQHAIHWEYFKQNPVRRLMGASEDLLEAQHADGSKFDVIICLGACMRKKTQLATAEIFNQRRKAE